jgi:formamidase
MKYEIRLDRTRRLATQPAKGHNRWHPAIPPVLKIDPGDEVVLYTLDALDCQIGSRHGVADAACSELRRDGISAAGYFF